MELNDIFTYTFLAKEMRIGKGLRIKERNLLSGKIIFPHEESLEPYCSAGQL